MLHFRTSVANALLPFGASVKEPNRFANSPFSHGLTSSPQALSSEPYCACQILLWIRGVVLTCIDAVSAGPLGENLAIAYWNRQGNPTG